MPISIVERNEAECIDSFSDSVLYQEYSSAECGRESGPPNFSGFISTDCSSLGTL